VAYRRDVGLPVPPVREAGLPDGAGDVEDGLSALDRPVHRRRVGDVAPDHLGPGEPRDAPRVAREHAQILAVAQQPPCQDVADEAGSAGH
jgi:hypothetical protein